MLLLSNVKYTSHLGYLLSVIMKDHFNAVILTNNETQQIEILPKHKKYKL